MVHYSLDVFLSLIIVTSYGISTGRKESWRWGRDKVNTNMKSFRLEVGFEPKTYCFSHVTHTTYHTLPKPRRGLLLAYRSLEGAKIRSRPFLFKHQTKFILQVHTWSKNSLQPKISIVSICSETSLTYKFVFQFNYF